MPRRARPPFSSEYKTYIVRSPHLLRRGGRLRTNSIQFESSRGWRRAGTELSSAPLRLSSSCSTPLFFCLGGVLRVRILPQLLMTEMCFADSRCARYETRADIRYGGFWFWFWWLGVSVCRVSLKARCRWVRAAPITNKRTLSCHIVVPEWVHSAPHVHLPPFPHSILTSSRAMRRTRRWRPAEAGW